MRNNPPPALPYIAELDGLRAIAILAVMAFHLDIFPIGWMGVPLFFVLSGFLITRILFNNSEADVSTYLKEFYWKRTVRIFPLYYFYLFVNFIIAILMGWSLNGYGWFILYLGNYQIGSFAPQVPGGIISHLWSLAVEEQFYIIWPFAVYFLRAYLKPLCLVIIAAAVVARIAILTVTDNPYMTILTLASCMDMLAAGAFAAIVRGRVPLFVLGAVGAILVAWGFSIVGYERFSLASLWVPEASFMFTGIGLLFCPLMRLAGQFKLLSIPPLIYIGKISYGLYMWHMLAFAISHRLPFGPVIQGTFGIVISFAFALTSWHLLESRFLKYKSMFSASSVNSRRKV